MLTTCRGPSEEHENLSVVISSDLCAEIGNVAVKYLLDEVMESYSGWSLDDDIYLM